jgi:hypothetical protein
MRGEPIEVTSKGTPTGQDDAHGSPILTAATTRTIEGVAVAPATSEETNDATGLRVVTGYDLYLPSGEQLLATDRITIRGVSGWMVEGDATAGQWTNYFTGRGKGVQVTVRRAS